MKKLVVFYSIGGNTRAIAKKVAKALDADLAEIRTVKTYPDDIDVLSGLGKREVESGYLPQLYPLPVDAQEYDTVIIGTPVWWYTFAPAVRCFMRNVKWAGKNVYTFATNAGWLGHTPSDFKKALKGANLNPTFSIKFNENSLLTDEGAIDEWIAQIK